MLASISTEYVVMRMREWVDNYPALDKGQREAFLEFTRAMLQAQEEYKHLVDANKAPTNIDRLKDMFKGG